MDTKAIYVQRQYITQIEDPNGTEESIITVVTEGYPDVCALKDMFPQSDIYTFTGVPGQWDKV